MNVGTYNEIPRENTVPTWLLPFKAQNQGHTMFNKDNDIHFDTEQDNELQC